MFEVIDRENKKYRFEDECWYEMEGEYVKVFTEKNCIVTLVTTFFSPVRVDNVDIYSTLCAPVYTLRPGFICEYCKKNNKN